MTIGALPGSLSSSRMPLMCVPALQACLTAQAILLGVTKEVVCVYHSTQVTASYREARSLITNTQKMQRIITACKFRSSEVLKISM